MTQPPLPTRNTHRVAGDFPQPTSPWESRGLLYAEVAGALAVLALVLLINTGELSLQPEPGPPQAVPTVTADSSSR